MSGFDSVIVVDWSSGNDRGPKPKADAIWIGAVLGGVEQEPAYQRNRAVAEDTLAHLIAQEIGAGRRLMVGFDFPFGYPKGFAGKVTGRPDPLALWDWFMTNLEDTPKGNNRFQLAGALNRLFPGIGPFWFNGVGADIPDLPRKGRDRMDHGMPERRACEGLARGTFTCWQMGGAGSVGGQAMTGMALLARLRRRFPEKIAAWPFEAHDRPVTFVEVWPSLIADAVARAGDPIRDRAQVRALSGAIAALPAPRLSRMLAVGAQEEGWILGLGHEEELRRETCPT